MSYLGRSAKLSLKAQEKVSFLATAGQTSKTGLSYTPSFVEVYVNGVLLTDTTDYTATNGNSITFTVALLLNDEVTVISLKTFTVADHYSKTEADTLLAAKAKLTKSATAPSSPAQGDMWFNTSTSTSGILTKAMAVYNGTAWQTATTGIPFTATGGTITTSGAYTIHTFTSSGTFTPAISGTVDYLVIAGGAGGGNLYGGGAGQLLTATGFSVAATGLTVTVGGGGARNSVGNVSVFSSITASAGLTGVAGTYGAAGTSGSGNIGGLGANNSNPYNGGGGGGNGSVGNNASSTTSGAGGSGTSNSYSGSAVTYAGGGGGGVEGGGTRGLGGSGGGGNGSGANGSPAGSSGTANTGSGGGGGDGTAGNGGYAGGSGIVIVRYLTP